MTEEPRRPHAHAGEEADLWERRGLGFEPIGEVTARVLLKLLAKVVANDNRRDDGSADH